MKIIIESIPHKDQRYPTCGDWYIRKDETGQEVMQIKVSQEMGEDSCLLVAIHELIEAKLAAKRGISVQQVDDFDIAYEKAHRKGGTLEGERLDESEPGDDPACPVFFEHGVATGIETMLCAMMGIPWAVHNATVEALP